MENKFSLKMYLEGYANVVKKAKSLGPIDLDGRKKEVEAQIEKAESKINSMTGMTSKEFQQKSKPYMEVIKNSEKEITKLDKEKDERAKNSEREKQVKELDNAKKNIIASAKEAADKAKGELYDKTNEIKKPLNDKNKEKAELVKQLKELENEEKTNPKKVKDTKYKEFLKSKIKQVTKEIKDIEPNIKKELKDLNPKKLSSSINDELRRFLLNVGKIDRNEPLIPMTEDIAKQEKETSTSKYKRTKEVAYNKDWDEAIKENEMIDAWDEAIKENEMIDAWDEAIKENEMIDAWDEAIKENEMIDAWDEAIKENEMIDAWDEAIKENEMIDAWDEAIKENEMIDACDEAIKENKMIDAWDEAIKENEMIDAWDAAIAEDKKRTKMKSIMSSKGYAGYEEKLPNDIEITLGRKGNIIFDGKEYKIPKKVLKDIGELDAGDIVKVIEATGMKIENAKALQEVLRTKAIDYAVIKGVCQAKNMTNSNRTAILNNYFSECFKASQFEKVENVCNIQYDLNDLSRAGGMDDFSKYEFVQRAKKAERFNIGKKSGEFKPTFLARVMSKIFGDGDIKQLAEKNEVREIENATAVNMAYDKDKEEAKDFLRSLRFDKTVDLGEKIGETTLDSDQIHEVKRVYVEENLRREEREGEEER